MRLDRFAPSLLALLVACGGSSKPVAQASPDGLNGQHQADPIAHTPGPTCKAVADHMAIILGDHQPAQLDGDVHLHAVFETRCDRDQWTDEARSCLATMESEPEAEGCTNMLTKEQQRALRDDRAKLTNADQPKADAVEDAAPPTKSLRRGATKKTDQPKRPGKTGDPCAGGE